MYKNTDPSAVAEMERQRLGESTSGDNAAEEHCISCNTSSMRETLYNTESFGTMCLSCAVRALYQRICDSLASLDPATRNMVTYILNDCDLEFLIKEEYSE